MRKLLGAALACALALSPGAVLAQQIQQFGLFGPIPPGTNAIGSVLSDLRVGGTAVATGNPVPVSIVSGGASGSTGSITAAGANGSSAQAVQGITGGIPLDAYPGQYNSTLPTFASGSPGYLSLDVNGRLILAPASSVSVSASALPTGAATAAKQPALGTAGTPSTDVLTVQGSAGGTALPVQSNSSITVTDTTGTIAVGGTANPLAANAARQILVISNTGAAPMTVRFGSAATATAGHILAPGANMTFDDKCPTGSVNLFSTSGTTFFVTSG